MWDGASWVGECVLLADAGTGEEARGATQLRPADTKNPVVMTTGRTASLTLQLREPFRFGFGQAFHRSPALWTACPKRTFSLQGF